MRWIVLAVITVLICAGVANAKTAPQKLSEVASLFAQRPIQALCYYDGEAGSPSGYGAWGYIKKPLGKQRAVHLDGSLCDAALHLNDESFEPWMRALGILVLVHESYHARRWGAAGNEAQVECKAIRHWRVGALMLGAEPYVTEELWPIALAAHYELANHADWNGTREYYDEGCIVPGLRGEDG